MKSGRLEKRKRLAIAVRISSLRDPAVIERTATENISPLGIRVVVSHHRDRNEPVVVISTDGNLQTQARVVYCQPLSDGQFALGLQFPQETSVWVKTKLGFEN